MGGSVILNGSIDEPKSEERPLRLYRTSARHIQGDMSGDADVTVWRLSQGDFELTSRDIG